METIRLVRAEDVDALYAISLATGFEGGDAAHLYADRKLMGHIYSAPYAALEPKFAIVVEDPEGVAGFAVGAVDTEAWEPGLKRNGGRACARTIPIRTKQGRIPGLRTSGARS